MARAVQDVRRIGGGLAYAGGVILLLSCWHVASAAMSASPDRASRIVEGVRHGSGGLLAILGGTSVASAQEWGRRVALQALAVSLLFDIRLLRTAHSTPTFVLLGVSLAMTAGAAWWLSTREVKNAFRVAGSEEGRGWSRRMAPLILAAAGAIAVITSF